MEARPNMVKKYNKPILGLAIGLIVPIIAFLIYYLIEYLAVGKISLSDFINVLIEQKNILAPSICVFANLIPYFIFKKIGYWYAIKGIVFSLVVYTLIFVVLTFIR